MFYALVFTLCSGNIVGAPCDEYVIDTHKSLIQCTKDMDERAKAANVLFKGNDNWIISCEATKVVKGSKK